MIMDGIRETRAPLLELAARLEVGTGADRRLDYEIFTRFAVKEAPNFWDPKSGHEYTTSLDAVVALLERVLPKRWYSFEGPMPHEDGPYFIGKMRAQKPSFAASPARALLAATLRALAEKLADADNNHSEASTP